ncbi:TagF domain-containing protein [Diaphorobacter aerolatus]|uniref:DUF2094 domain-containing protein n=1 Tax=Diaphorobacter aerolatus TaxID=1288495 RepID=A0A7H0GLK3_9BURK|nr:TagF domain-containing protein [Diaphorobacter aerolatus]QNP49169.1 DUF2094 domain-containing protein [Diaphorobacter aerolatus]
MPSVDSVGRYFPLTLASELSRAPRGIELGNECAQWWHRATHAALSALEEDMNASAFELALNTRFSMPIEKETRPDEAIADVLSRDWVWPLQGECLWLADPWGATARPHMRCFGLPRGERFSHLFGSKTHLEHSAEGGA